MEIDKKLESLYIDCINELKEIGINVINNKLVGEIDIKIAKRNSNRYACCKQEEPDKKFFHVLKRGRKKYIIYDRFKKHHIEVNKWVMDLNDQIIKNTIMHEIIHCLPNCNNHGREFKKYAKYINQKLGYEIKTVGNKKEDYESSNIEFKEDEKKYKYKIICEKCGQVYLRQKLKKNYIKLYRCGKCNGKLIIYNIK